MSRVRSLFFSLPVIVLGTVLLGIFEAITWSFDRTGKWQQRLSHSWCRMVLASGSVRVRATGLHKLHPRSRYVYVANHTSYLDTPALMAHLPADVRFFGYSALFNIPFFGAHMKRAGHLPVDSSSARASFRSMTEGSRLVAERGISVVLFPEGSRSRHGLRPFREGAAYIAIKAGVPVVPVAIVGMGALMPVGSLYIRSGEVEIRVGDPIPTAGLHVNDRGALTRQIRDEVARLLQDGNSSQSDLGAVQERADSDTVVQAGGGEWHGMDRP